jgi:hypothetical protein
MATSPASGTQSLGAGFLTPPTISANRFNREKMAMAKLEPELSQLLQVLSRAACRGARGGHMKKLLLIGAAVSCLMSTGVLAQSSVVTTTGVGHTGSIQIEPEYRTRIHTYVTEHRVRPVVTKEKIVVGSPVPRDVELEAVPSDWGPSLNRYRYFYSGERVMLVDPESRTVVQEVD